MVQTDSRTPRQQAQWVSALLTHSGRYGVVTQWSQTIGVARQTLYRWKEKGRAALEAAFTPATAAAETACQLERAILTLLVEGHASYRGIQCCLQELLHRHVSLGTITAIVQTAGQRAQQWRSSQRPLSPRVLALDELYGSQRGQAYLSVVDSHSGAVWASPSPVAVDAESWTLLLWQLQEQGLQWETTISDGGKAIVEAVQTVSPEQAHRRDVWHVLQGCHKVQGRLDRLVEGLEKQAVTVARQAARLAAGKPLRGRHPKSDVAAHAAELAHAQYVASSLSYLAAELRRLLEVVVLAPIAGQGVLPSHVRQGELEALLALLDELSQAAPESRQDDVVKLIGHLRAALPHLVLFAPSLDTLHEQACQTLGASTLHLIAWAWQRRAILGPTSRDLLAGLPPEWRLTAESLMAAWDAVVRASSAVENWHSILRPYVAVHRQLSAGFLALLALWHNHRLAPRGLHRGQSPLMRSGLAEATSDWLAVLGYPSQGPAPVAELSPQQQPPLALVA
jgi:Transposase, Mutator family